MLYAILKVVIQVSLKVFFRKIRVLGKEHIPTKGPMIVISNHPNTFMDPLLLAAKVKTPVYFLTNSSIFATPFTRWLFSKLHMIPIQRKIDTTGPKLSNEEIFKKCYEFLGQGGTLLIFPEGLSIWERRLRPLKTGTARIALGAEAQHNFDLDLKIIPFGLNYSKPESFRSEVLMTVDQPIRIKEYQQAYQEDEFGAAQSITEAMRKSLEEHIIITKDEEEDQLAHRISRLYREQLSEEIKLAPKKTEQAYLMDKGIVEALQYFQDRDPERVQRFKIHLEGYLRNLDRLHLSDDAFSNKSPKPGIFWASLLSAFKFLLGLPLFIYGLLNNYIPYIIPSQVANVIVKWSKVPEYTAPVMMITGIFSFGFFYPLQIFLFYILSSWAWGTVWYALSLPISGFFALFYANYLHDTRDKWRLLALFYKRSDLVSQLVMERKALIQTLNQAKKEYLTSSETE